MKILQRIGLVLGCLGLMLNLNIIIPDDVSAQEPPPRPVPSASSTDSGNSGGGGEDDDDDGGIISRGDIFGTVMDTTTGEPAAGVTVMINDTRVNTDASGHFSLTGVNDGIYTVGLDLSGDLAMAGTQSVVSVNGNVVYVDLSIYTSSTSPAFSDEIPSAEPASFQPPVEQPEVMPQTGGFSPWVNIGGFILFLAGILIWTLGSVRVLEWLAP